MKFLRSFATAAIMTAFALAPAFAYGGGGGGGGSSSTSYNPELRPSFSAISPAKNAVLDSAQTISFEVSANAASNSIVVEVNGENVESTVTQKESGVFVVTAPMGSVEEGTVLISLEASAAISPSYKRTYIYPVTVGKTSVGLPAQSGEEKQAQNQCESKEVSGDTSYDAMKEYSDIAGNANEEYIKKLTEMCVFHGEKGSDKFKPNAAFNRAAAVKTIIKAFGYKYFSSVSSNPFGDVKANEWYAPYVAAAKSAGLVRGYGNGSFGPANNMNIAEGLALVARASGANISGYPGGEWYAPYMAWGVDKGLIDKNTKANWTLTRGALARMISSL